MPASPDALFALLGRLGIATTTVEHAPVFTVEQSQSLRGLIAGGHTKNLFLVDRNDRLFLVVAEETARIDLKALPLLIGAGRLSFGKPELLRTALAVEPGAVTPFALINDAGQRVTLVLDQALLAHAELNFHPLVNSRTTRIRTADLLRFFQATGHRPVVVAMPSRAA